MASSAHVDVSRDKSDESRLCTANMALSPAHSGTRNDWLGLGSPNSDEGDDELDRNEDLSARLPAAPPGLPAAPPGALDVPPPADMTNAGDDDNQGVAPVQPLDNTANYIDHEFFFQHLQDDGLEIPEDDKRVFERDKKKSKQM